MQDFVGELISELRRYADRHFDYRPKIVYEDEYGSHGPRVSPGGADFADLYKVAKQLASYLDLTPADDWSNEAGLVVHWAIDNRKQVSWIRPPRNVFDEIADKLAAIDVKEGGTAAKITATEQTRLLLSGQQL